MSVAASVLSLHCSVAGWAVVYVCGCKCSVSSLQCSGLVCGLCLWLLVFCLFIAVQWVGLWSMSVAASVLSLHCSAVGWSVVYVCGC